MKPLDRLQQEEHCRQQDNLVAQVADKEQHKTYHGKEQQHVTRREESRIQRRECHEQDQTPQETIAEILPLPLLIGRLDIKSKPEQQGENRVCLSRKQGKHPVEHRLVHDLDPTRLPLRIDRENEMFQIVHQNDGQHRKSAQGIHHLDAGDAAFHSR